VSPSSVVGPSSRQRRLPSRAPARRLRRSRSCRAGGGPVERRDRLDCLARIGVTGHCTPGFVPGRIRDQADDFVGETVAIGVDVPIIYACARRASRRMISSSSSARVSIVISILPTASCRGEGVVGCGVVMMDSVKGLGRCWVMFSITSRPAIRPCGARCPRVSRPHAPDSMPLNVGVARVSRRRTSGNYARIIVKMP